MSSLLTECAGARLCYLMNVESYGVILYLKNSTVIQVFVVWYTDAKWPFNVLYNNKAAGFNIFLFCITVVISFTTA